MAVIRLAGFNGANKALHPKMLPESVGVNSLNQRPDRGDLRPLRAPTTVATVPAGRNTIYRLGRDTPSDTVTWLSWPGVVHTVRGFVAEDTSERTYFSGDGQPKWTDNIKLLVSPRLLGVPAPAAAPTLVASGGVSTTTEVRFYCYTYVTDAGEESAPSPVSAAITMKPDATVAISGLSAAPAGNYGITLINVYRTQSGSSGTEFFFLRQIASNLTSTTDDNRALNEVLETTNWYPPPATLYYLTGMWNGMMAGIYERSVRYCETGVPYAWPKEYEQVSPDGRPVALATFGQNLLVLTTNRPRIVTGGSPDSLDDQPLDFKQACIAFKSVVSMGYGVVYAAPDGLAFVGQGGARIITEGILSRDDWQALGPTSIVGMQYEGYYIGCYYDGVALRGFQIDPKSPQGIFFMDFGYQVSHLDEIQDALFVLSGTSVQKWDTGTALTTTFRSKEFRQTKPTRAFACAEVVADSYAAVTFKLFADGVLKHTQAVTSRAAFRLPAGYYANDYQIEITTTSPVQAVAMAHSMAELAGT